MHVLCFKSILHEYLLGSYYVKDSPCNLTIVCRYGTVYNVKFTKELNVKTRYVLNFAQTYTNIETERGMSFSETRIKYTCTVFKIGREDSLHIRCSTAGCENSHTSILMQLCV